MIVQVSSAYSIVGMMHVSTNFHIVFISSWLKSLLPAMLNMVCSAASVFLYVFVIWSSMVPLLFIVVPIYLYVIVLSRLIFPNLNAVSGYFPIVMVWLFLVQILSGIFLYFFGYI